jgi:hypothetical protein
LARTWELQKEFVKKVTKGVSNQAGDISVPTGEEEEEAWALRSSWEG